MNEVIIRENRRYFVVILAVPGTETYSLSPLEMELGQLYCNKAASIKVICYTILINTVN